MTIRILPQNKINLQRWDACVKADPDGLIYSNSWVLNKLCEAWLGLVVNDYQAVLAIPVKSRLGFRFVAMPSFIQQLNLTGSFDDKIVETVGNRLLSFSRFIEISTATQDLLPKSAGVRRRNYVLNLNRDAETIINNLSPDCGKNIAKAKRRGCCLTYKVSINDVLNFYARAYLEKSAYRSEHLNRLASMLILAQQKSSCIVAGVADEKNDLVYAGILLDDGRRLYYILGAPTEKGRQMRATYFFISEMLQAYARKRRWFDFEGSEIPSVATFYRSFQPEEEIYYRYFINRFPQPFKRLINWKIGY